VGGWTPAIAVLGRPFLGDVEARGGGLGVRAAGRCLGFDLCVGQNIEF